MITVCSTDDRYADDVHYRGGAVLALEMLSWGASMLSFNAIAPDPEVAGEGWRDAWLERIDSVEPYEHEWLRHQRRDDYWKQGSVCEDFDAIRCPVYAIGGFADGYSEAVFRILAGMARQGEGPARPVVALVPGQVEPGPAIGFLQECLRWWDRWLKGEDTGIAGEPALRVWMQEPVTPAARQIERPGRWVAEEGWPSPNIEERRLSLGDGALAASRPTRPVGGSTLLGSPTCSAASTAASGAPTAPTARARSTSAPTTAARSASLGSARGADRAARQRARGAGAGERPPGRAARRPACDVAPDGTSLLVTRGV